MASQAAFAQQAAPPPPTASNQQQQQPQAPPAPMGAASTANSNSTSTTSIATARIDGALQALEAHRESTRRDAATANNIAGNANATNVNKRKRQGSDQQDVGPMAGDDATTALTPARRGGLKRVAGNNTSNTNDAVVLSSSDLGDAAASALMAATSQASQEDVRRASASSLDFGALSQAPSQRSQLAIEHQQQALEQLSSRATAGTLADATSTAAAALAGIYPTMTVPQPTALTFANSSAGAGAGGDNERNLDPAFGMNDQEGGGHAQQAGGFESDTSPSRMLVAAGSTPGQAGRESGSQKPAVGSEDWHRMRRDNHKEVERRRRETINEGINELAKIVPGCEKNKGSILQRAVAFIIQLKENEEQNIEKWTLEKLLGEQAIAELSAGMDRYKQELERLKQENERARHETEMWKKKCETAGISSGSEDGGRKPEAES